MKKLILFLFIIICIPFHGFSVNKTKQLQQKLDAVCKELVPDKRVDVCRVKVSKGKNGKMELWGEVLDRTQKEKILAAVSGKRITDKIIILPDTSVVKKPWGVITVSVANMKTEPSHASEMASQAIMGTPVRILKKENSWSYIQTPDHYLAWVTTGSVKEMSETELDGWKNSEKVIFPDNYGLIFNDIRESEIISDLVAGSILVKSGKSGDFLEVVLPDGRKGFLPDKNVVLFHEWEKREILTAEQLVTTAKKFLGLPYMWGGTSSKTVDCSGFMKNIWFLNVIILERDASQQHKYGEVIESGKNFENLKPGDVLFFGRKDPLRIIHTGMYIGEGKVIHASGRVMINSIDPSKPDYSSYLGTTYVGTKRVSGQKPQFGYMPVRDHPWYSSKH